MQDWANPHVRRLINLYPEITSSISKSWQTGKWLNEVPLEELTPMWADWEGAPNRHFYVEEVACTTSGQYIFPRRWVVVDDQECAEGHPVHFSKRVGDAQHPLLARLSIFQKGKYWVQKEEIIRVPANKLQLTYPEIKALGYDGFQGTLTLTAFEVGADCLKRVPRKSCPSSCKGQTGLQPPSYAMG